MKVLRTPLSCTLICQRLRLSIQIASLFLSAIITPFILPPAPFRGKIKGRSGALVCLSFFITVVGMGNLRDTVLGAGNTGDGFLFIYALLIGIILILS